MLQKIIIGVIGIVALLSLVLSTEARWENTQQKNISSGMISNIDKLIKFDSVQNQDILAQEIITRAIADDYPLKMKLGDREWCKNRVCMKALGE